MKPYNPRHCQSLFGYAAAVHRRSGGRCQLCGCGDAPLDFDLWRQLTVEHLIGKSQGGYLRQIRQAVEERFPDLPPVDKEDLSRRLDEANTVTACSFCNSTTSRDVSPHSMKDLLNRAIGAPDEVLRLAVAELQTILEHKRADVQWKLESVRAAFEKEVRAPIEALQPTITLRPTASPSAAPQSKPRRK